jgi:calcineurin-like phosphoesterase family protein
VNKTFFIADTHFGDEDVLIYEKRPFKDVDDMDETMLKNWNSVVGKDDTIIIAGDFCWYTDRNDVADLMNALNGKKIFIIGNHDVQKETWYHNMGNVQHVSAFPIIYKEWFVVSHKPPEYFNEATPYFWVYGHVHATELYQTVTKRSACVCVERWNYTPVALETLIDCAKALGSKF